MNEHSTSALKPLRILIIDDHIMFLEGLVAVLQQTTQWQIVAQATSGEKGVELAIQHRPDFVILDISMPGMGGVEAAQLIRQRVPDTNIIAISMHDDYHHVEQMFEAGAKGYILKNEAFGKLITAVEMICNGKSFISAEIEKTGSGTPSLKILSLREREVLQLLADGHKTSQIAKQLDIRIKTVETYRSRLMLKLEIDNLPALIRYAIKVGISKL